MNYHLLGVIAGAVVGLLIYLIIMIIKKENIRKEYDERQLAARGICYKYAFFTLSALVVAYACLMAFNPEMILLLGPVGLGTLFLISMGVFVISAIMKDAYEAINDNRNWPVSIAVIGVANIIIGITNIFNVGIVEDGALSFVCLNFECGILLFVTVLVYKIKQNMDKRED